MTNEMVTYQKAIEKYIAEHRARGLRWPEEEDRGVWGGFLARNSLDIPFLSGMLDNFLPLYQADKPKGYLPQIVGILPSTAIQIVHIDCVKHPFSADVWHSYESLSEMFKIAIPNYWLYLVDSYQQYLEKMRERYVDIAPMLIDPPPVPPEIREYEWVIWS